jgi:hypothetical protein
MPRQIHEIFAEIEALWKERDALIRKTRGQTSKAIVAIDIRVEKLQREMVACRANQ